MHRVVHSMGRTGRISEVGRSEGELLLEWTIPRFLSLCERGTDFYESPPVGFGGGWWYMLVWPNRECAGRVDLKVGRRDDGVDAPPMRLNVAVAVRGAGGGADEWRREVEREFGNRDFWLFDNFCQRSELRDRGLMPEDELRIACEIRVPAEGIIEASVRNLFTAAGSIYAWWYGTDNNGT